jgi:hypothetical protein
MEEEELFQQFLVDCKRDFHAWDKMTFHILRYMLPITPEQQKERSERIAKHQELYDIITDVMKRINMVYHNMMHVKNCLTHRN